MEYTDPDNYSAGSKARDDAREIFERNGAVFTPLYRSGSDRRQIIRTIAASLRRLSKRLKQGDYVYIQYPYSPQIVNVCLIRMLHAVCIVKGARLGILLHDLKSFRYYDFRDMRGFAKRMAGECTLLSECNYVIAHNPRMKKLLRKYGCSSHIINLQVFDYLYTGPMASVSDENVVIIAGNLSEIKSGYIYKLSEQKDILFRLYGMNYKEGSAAGPVEYAGAFPPDELIGHLDGRYGLVWDGDSTASCTGDYGIYLKYNDPHKFSLYIAAGLPVIVWDRSALAGYVKKNRLGIAVSSLENLAQRLEQFTDEEYRECRRSVQRLRRKIISGSMLTQSIREIRKID